MVQGKEIVIGLTGYTECAITKEANGEIIIRLIPNTFADLQEGDRTLKSKAEKVGEGQYIYFTKISKEDREKVKKWLQLNNFAISRRKRKFLKIVKEALERIDYDFWIANIEPSVKDGKMYYAECEEVGVGFTVKECEKMAGEYDPERGSRLSNLHELFLWYAVRIANGLWTLNYVTKDSSSAGNYWDAPGASRKRDKTGLIKCGGYKDGQGNTKKIVTVEDGYAKVGGNYFSGGRINPVAAFIPNIDPSTMSEEYSAVVVLTK